MKYSVRALDAQQQLQALDIEALDLEHVRRLVAERGLLLLSAKQSRMGVHFGAANKAFDLLLFAQELLALVSAGLSVVQALDALIERAGRDQHRIVLEGLRDGLRSGLRLSQACLRQSEIFPPLFVGVLQAAESTSNLPEVLERYVTYETRLRGLRQKMVNAAIYPAILLVAGVLVAAFLLGYVVPRFAVVYQGASKTLPWASQMLLAWGKLVSENMATMFSGALVSVVALVLVGNQMWRSGAWMRALQKLPVLRQRVEMVSLTRLYLTLGMLLAGGIPIIKALVYCDSVLLPSERYRLQSVRDRVSHGIALSAALEEQTLATPVSMRLLQVGEQTGQLGTMLIRTAEFHDAEVARWIERWSKSFEPILMMAIGLLIGGIVILLYMPIFDMAGSI